MISFFFLPGKILRDRKTSRVERKSKAGDFSAGVTSATGSITRRTVS